MKQILVFVLLLGLLLIAPASALAQEATEELTGILLFNHMGSHSIDERNLSEEAVFNDVATVAADNPYLDGIAIGTYLDYPEEYAWWTDAAHENGLAIHWRTAGYNTWQGRNGFDATGTPEQHNADFGVWLAENCHLLEPGDGLSVVPDEAANGNHWYNDGRNGVGSVPDEFNQFIQDAVTQARQVLDDCGEESISIFYYDNPSVVKDVLSDETLAMLDFVGTNNYSDRGQAEPQGIAEAMEDELTSWAVGVHDNKPWGITTGVGVYMDDTFDEANYAEALGLLLPSVYETLPNLYVLTLWQFGNRGNDPRNRLYDYDGNQFVARQPALDAIINWAAQVSP